MQTFKITRELEAICQWQNTRYGFKHTATLLRNGRELLETKACYYNRTWEAYEFESVLESLLEKSKKDLSEYELKTFKNKIKNQFRKDDPAMKNLKTIGMVMAMGEVLAGDSKKEKNDWKARMLKAGLENRGLIMPEDWETLSEDDKEARLNGVISQLG